MWIPWRLQSSNRAGYLVGGLQPGGGLHPPLALGEELNLSGWVSSAWPSARGAEKDKGKGVGEEMQVK